MMVVLAAVVFLLGLGALATARDRNALVPATFFVVLWAGYALVTVGVFATDRAVYGPAMLWLVAACAAVVAGSAFAGRVDHPATTRPAPAELGTLLPGLRPVTTLLVVACVAHLIWIFARAGFSWRNVASAAVIAQVSSLNRSSFGYGDLEQGMAERFLFIADYGGPLFAGLLFRVRRHWLDRGISMLALYLGVLIPTLYGSRMGVLFGGSFWLAAFMAAHVYIRRPAGAASARFLFQVAGVAVAVLMGLSLLAMMVRYRWSFDQGRSFAYLVADPFAFLAAFAYWFREHGLRLHGLLAGFRDFEHWFAFFGLHVGQARGALQDWPAIHVGFTSSNIYTLFRFLIEDFGILGALLWLFGFGALSARAFRAVLRGSRLAVAWLAVCYSYVLTSFSMSLLYYVTVTAGIALFVGYFVALELLDRGPGRRSGLEVPEGGSTT